MVQLALIALSLMLGRRIGPDEYPKKIGGFLDQIAERAEPGSKHLFPLLRHWLERALQMNGTGFECAQDAQRALSELPEDRQARMSRLARVTGRHISARNPAPDAKRRLYQRRDRFRSPSPMLRSIVVDGRRRGHGAARCRNSFDQIISWDGKR